MPTYEYECSNCEHLFEAFHFMTAEPLVDCPQCHQPKLIKLIGMGAAVVIPGTENPCRGNRGGKTQKRTEKPVTNDKLGQGKNKTEKPFWRDGPVNKDVLKNPKKYIQEGKTE